MMFGHQLITYEALGLCKLGEAHKMVERGDNTYGGKYVVNPSGGLEAKGHPLGATGLGMHFYICSTHSSFSCASVNNIHLITMMPLS